MPCGDSSHRGWKTHLAGNTCGHSKEHWSCQLCGVSAASIQSQSIHQNAYVMCHMALIDFKEHHFQFFMPPRCSSTRGSVPVGEIFWEPPGPGACWWCGENFSRLKVHLGRLVAHACAIPSPQYQKTVHMVLKIWSIASAFRLALLPCCGPFDLPYGVFKVSMKFEPLGLWVEPCRTLWLSSQGLSPVMLWGRGENESVLHASVGGMFCWTLVFATPSHDEFPFIP